MAMSSDTHRRSLVPPDPPCGEHLQSGRGVSHSGPRRPGSLGTRPGMQWVWADWCTYFWSRHRCTALLHRGKHTFIHTYIDKSDKSWHKYTLQEISDLTSRPGEVTGSNTTQINSLLNKLPGSIQLPDVPYSVQLSYLLFCHSDWFLKCNIIEKEKKREKEIRTP